MTIASATNRMDYVGNNTTDTYSYTFKIFSQNDLSVTKKNTSGVETLLTVSTDYTVTGVGSSSGGTIVLTAGDLPTDYTLTIRRVRQLIQDTDIRNQGDFYPEGIENAFDHGIMVSQQISEEVDRSVKLPESLSASAFDPTLPTTIADSANKVVIINSTGDGFSIGPTSNEIQNAQTYAEAAAISAETVRTEAGVREIDTISDMKALTSDDVFNGMSICLLGYHQVGDNGGGLFYWDASSTETNNNGTIVKCTSITTGRFKRIYNGAVYARWFGAKGDGITDDYTSLQSAINYCIEQITPLYLGVGKFAWGTTIDLPVYGALIGQEYGPQQNGSDLQSTTLIWIGGSHPMITMNGGWNRLAWFGVENHGTATCFAECHDGIAPDISNCWFINGTGHTLFSESVFNCYDTTGYGTFSRLSINSPAPKFLNFDGTTVPGLGVTPFRFCNRCIIESSNTDMTLIYIKDLSFDCISFEDCTFNQQSGELTIVDTTDTPRSSTIYSLNMDRCEWDVASSVSTDRMMKLTNVSNFKISGGQFNGGGIPDYLVDLVNSNATVDDLYFVHSNGPFFNADSNSRVTILQNRIDVASTSGWVNTSTGYEAAITIPFTGGNAGQIRFDYGRGHIPTTFMLTASDATAVLITYNGQMDTFLIAGQIVNIIIKNTHSAGVNVSFDTPFHLIGSALTLPATGKNRTYSFVYMGGGKFYEMFRSSGDVSN